MNSSPSLLAPADKHDVIKVEVLAAAGYPAVEPVLPALLEWVQDVNWPVAIALVPFLATIGAPLAPHCRRIFATDDDIWKYNVIEQIVAPSPELRSILKSELEKFALHPTPGEKREGVDVAAHEALNCT
jgi:hypothetical protein